MSKIYPILMCGGAGTRLWPLSRKCYPKQFVSIVDDETLFQKSANRFCSNENLQFQNPTVITSEAFRFVVGEQLDEIGIVPRAILIEPVIKNTAAPILGACLHIIEEDPDGILVVTPSDHLIPDVQAFQQALTLGLPQLANQEFITFGISPATPETGYGYLKLKADRSANEDVERVTKFVEKPDIETAYEMVVSGNYLWNSGIFLFKAKDMIAAYKEHQPDIFHGVSLAFEKGKSDLNFFRYDATEWDHLESISLDHAIMENASNIMAVKFSGYWSDLGDWNSIWKEGNQDSNNNVSFGDVAAIDTTNSLLFSEKKNSALVCMGIDNMIVVSTSDAILVTDKARAQDVKLVVEHLKKTCVPQAETSNIDYRPWGWFEVLVSDNKYKVKRIHVKPGASLSLQSHNYRAEHWIVVSGTANVVIDDDVKVVESGESVFVPKGAVHRMENLGEIPMVLVEVQTGTYFGEDDIVRYSDIYDRQ